MITWEERQKIANENLKSITGKIVKSIAYDVGYANVTIYFTDGTSLDIDFPAEDTNDVKINGKSVENK